jgi:Putative inner membrane exporter, YdcZ
MRTGLASPVRISGFGCVGRADIGLGDCVAQQLDDRSPFLGFQNLMAARQLRAAILFLQNRSGDPRAGASFPEWGEPPVATVMTCRVSRPASGCRAYYCPTSAISKAAGLLSLLAAPRLGAAVYVGLFVTASSVASVIADHFGWLGFDQHTASLGRIVGCALMVLGIGLVSLF